MADAFVLDTNVVAELERPAPNPAILAWFAAQSADDLYLTATIVGELWFGVALKKAPAATRSRPGSRRCWRPASRAASCPSMPPPPAFGAT